MYCVNPAIAPQTQTPLGSRAEWPACLDSSLILIAVVLRAGLAACGGDDDSAGSPPKTATSQPDTGTATEPTPAEAQKALKDTSQRPVIPKPTGSPPRKLVVEDIVKGKGKAAKKGDTVIVNYVGENFSNGKEFDASWDRGQPFPVTIGADAGDRGLDTRARRDPEGRPANAHDPARAGLRAERLPARDPAERDPDLGRGRCLGQVAD